MLFSTVGQAWVFLATVYGGVALGLLYDIGRMVRDALKANHATTMVVDGVFWLAAAAAMFVTIWLAGVGELRAFMLLGFVCGWALYEIALSRLVMAVYRLLRDALRKVAATGVGKRLFR